MIFAAQLALTSVTLLALLGMVSLAVTYPMVPVFCTGVALFGMMLNE